MKKDKFVIGLTGGIASGKSSVASYFSALGIDVFDSDQIARQLFAPHSEHLTVLREHFGESIFESEQVLDRKALGKLVFSNPEELAWLNQFTHPLINRAMKQQLESSQSSYVILDIPLLINKQGEIPDYLSKMIDRVLVINLPLKTQLYRLQQRDGISEQEAMKIINSQSSLQQKLALADDVIDNIGDLQSLNKAVKHLHEQFIRQIGASED